MAYDTYTKNEIFADENINVLCNRIMDKLEKEFLVPDINTKFGVTGTVAKIIQGASLTPVKCISFATNDDDVYKYLIKNISSILKIKGRVDFEDRIQVIHAKAHIEFWKLGTLTLINNTGIYCQDDAEIPAYIL